MEKIIQIHFRSLVLKYVAQMSILIVFLSKKIKMFFFYKPLWNATLVGWEYSEQNSAEKFCDFNNVPKKSCYKTKVVYSLELHNDEIHILKLFSP